MVAPTTTASELSTKRALLGCFADQPASRSLAVGLVVVLAARLIVGRPSLADLVVAAIVVVLIGPTEWLIHRGLFHAPPTSFRARRLRTGIRHRRHHDEPTSVHWLVLDVRGIILLMVLVALSAAAVALPVAATVGRSRPLAGPTLSAVLLAWLALANYEWTHLLVHSRYRPRTRRYRRLARHHLAHHHRDATTWLGVTTNLGDRLLGTT